LQFSAFDSNVTDLDGNVVDMSQFRGNVSIVINVATYWGLTVSQYTALNALFKVRLLVPIKVTYALQKLTRI